MLPSPPRRVLAGLAVAVLSSCSTSRTEVPGGRDLTLGEEADGRTIPLARGNVVVVKLPATPGSGYTWTASVDAPGVLDQLGPPTYQPAPEGGGARRVGQPQVQVFWFRANAAGTAELRLAYSRRWEWAVEPLRHYRVTVAVR